MSVAGEGLTEPNLYFAKQNANESLQACQAIVTQESSLTAVPVAVPDIFLGFEKPSSAIDRCHSLSSLVPPPAALASLPLLACQFYLAGQRGSFPCKTDDQWSPLQINIWWV